jgi:hypothetical protein
MPSCPPIGLVSHLLETAGESRQDSLEWTRPAPGAGALFGRDTAYCTEYSDTRPSRTSSEHDCACDGIKTEYYVEFDMMPPREVGIGRADCADCANCDDPGRQASWTVASEP